MNTIAHRFHGNRRGFGRLWLTIEQMQNEVGEWGWLGKEKERWKNQELAGGTERVGPRDIKGVARVLKIKDGASI